MVRKHDLSYLIALLLIFLFGATFACETELPEETNIEISYP